MEQIWNDSPYRLFLFDAYGTLFRTNAENEALNAASGGQADAIFKLWRRKQLEYSWCRSMMGRWVNFDEVTLDALNHALQKHKVYSEEMVDQFMTVYEAPELFPDVMPLLDAVKEKGHRAAILSNAPTHLLTSATERHELLGHFSDLISADDVEMFKPSPLMYRVVTQFTKVQPEEVLFFSANAWDIAGASTYGFNTVWVNRQDDTPDYLGVQPLYTVNSLTDVLPS